MKEYESVKSRFDFLTEQTSDLESAIATLNKIIRTLKGRIHTQFNERLLVLQYAFKKYFHELFSGGSADITVVQNDDTHEMGIDITVHLPGKKVPHTMTLSGGERSLVSVALLCAIISSNPPP